MSIYVYIVYCLCMVPYGHHVILYVYMSILPSVYTLLTIPSIMSILSMCLCTLNGVYCAVSVMSIYVYTVYVCLYYSVSTNHMFISMYCLYRLYSYTYMLSNCIVSIPSTLYLLSILYTCTVSMVSTQWCLSVVLSKVYTLIVYTVFIYSI